MSSRALTAGQLLYDWLSTFATTYRGVLPAGLSPETPYLQFTGQADNVASQFVQGVSIYVLNTSSYYSVIAVADLIEQAIGEGGLLIGNDSQHIKIDKGSPFYQDKAGEDENVRAGYINLLITIY